MVSVNSESEEKGRFAASLRIIAVLSPSELVNANWIAQGSHTLRRDDWRQDDISRPLQTFRVVLSEMGIVGKPVTPVMLLTDPSGHT